MLPWCELQFMLSSQGLFVRLLEPVKLNDSFYAIYRKKASNSSQTDVMIGYLDPYRGTSALKKLLCFWHQNGLVTGSYRGALALRCMALRSCSFQGKIHGLVTVQTVSGVVHPSPILLPWGNPLSPAVMICILGGFCAALCCDWDQWLGSGTRGYRWRCFFVTCVSYSYRKN